LRIFEPKKALSESARGFALVLPEVTTDFGCSGHRRCFRPSAVLRCTGLPQITRSRHLISELDLANRSSRQAPTARVRIVPYVGTRAQKKKVKRSAHRALEY
jgi:hypothetical protein